MSSTAAPILTPQAVVDSPRVEPPLWRTRRLQVLVIMTALLALASWAFIALSIDDGKVVVTTQAVTSQLHTKLLSLRIGKLGPMIVVGFAVGIATVVFQTITKNRILTPALWGSTPSLN